MNMILYHTVYCPLYGTVSRRLVPPGNQHDGGKQKRTRPATWQRAPAEAPGAAADAARALLASSSLPSLSSERLPTGVDALTDQVTEGAMASYSYS